MTGEGEAPAADPLPQDVEIGLEKLSTVSEPVQVGPGNELGEPAVGTVARWVRQGRNGFGKIAERRPDGVERPIVLTQSRMGAPCTKAAAPPLSIEEP